MPFPTSNQLNTNIQSLKPSATLAINERSAALIAEGKKVYRLGFGQSPFPVPAEVVSALRANAHVKDYLAVEGLGALRESVAKFTKRTIGLTCTAADVLIGPGSKELIFNLQLAFNGKLLLPSPSWVSYQPQSIVAFKRGRWIKTEEKDGWKLTPQNLEATCLKDVDEYKILVLNYPNNPVGNTYSDKELEGLAGVAGKYGVVVVADEIYAETFHDGLHVSIAKYYPEGTIISSGLSKWCGAGGWRLGTFVFPEGLRWLRNAMATIASETFTSVSAPIQMAAITAFEGSPVIDAYIASTRKILKSIGRYVHAQLTCAGVTMPLPEGGFYLFPNFENHRPALAQRGILNSTDLCEALLNEAGVALLPGVAFGRPAEELTARLSFVDFDGGKAIEALDGREVDDGFIERYCPNVVMGAAKLVEWLGG